MKILFYGFRHAHIDGLYKMAAEANDLEIVACLEEDEAAGKEVAKRLGITFAQGTYGEWLATDVDIVAIGGRYGDRGAAVIKALKAGKHIISDKPLCTSLEELEEIERLAREKQLKIACMLDLRYLPATCRAKEILQSGRLGEVRNISFSGQHCLSYGTRPGWYFEEGMHGGTINDLAIHGIDLVRELTSLEFEQVDGIRTWNAYADRIPDFKDCAVFMARLSNGAEVLADVSYSAPSQVFSMPTYWNFKIWCEKGLLTFQYTDSHVTVYEEGCSQPQVYEGLPVETDYLTDLIREIKRLQTEQGADVDKAQAVNCHRESVDALTAGVIASTRAALRIQKEA